MAILSPRDREMVSLGAAIASNCIPCVEFHVPEARKAGFDDAQILEAIRIADSVRQVPAKKVLGAASSLLNVPLAEAAAGQAASCGDMTVPAVAGKSSCCG